MGGGITGDLSDLATMIAQAFADELRRAMQVGEIERATVARICDAVSQGIEPQNREPEVDRAWLVSSRPILSLWREAAGPPREPFAK